MAKLGDPTYNNLKYNFTNTDMGELKKSIDNGFFAIGFILFIILAVLLFPIIGWHIIWVMPVIMLSFAGLTNAMFKDVGNGNE